MGNEYSEYFSETEWSIGCLNWDIENYVAVLCIDNCWRLWPEVLL